LYYERESWSVVGGQATAVFHVKVPFISSTVDGTIYIYYRTTDTADGSDPLGNGNVWNANFVCVYHLTETGNGIVGEYKDSTVNANHARGGDGDPAKVPAQTASGPINGAQDFDGTDDFIRTSVLTGGGTVATATIEVWLKADSKDAFDGLVTAGFSLGLLLSGVGGNPLTYMWENTSDEWNAGTGLAITNGTTYYGAVAISPTEAIVYLNTTSWTNTKIHSAKNINVAWIIGRDRESLGRVWDGFLDEIRISKINRTAAQIKCSYNSGAGLLVLVGVEEVSPASRKGQLSWAEFEAPSAASRRGQLSWAEFRVPVQNTAMRLRAGLANRLRTIAGLEVYERWPGQINSPSAIIGLNRIEPHYMMGSDIRAWHFSIHLFQPLAGGMENAQDRMDPLLATSSTGGIYGAIAGDRTLGGIAHSTFVRAMRDYDVMGINEQLSYMGAVIDAEVWA